MLAKRSFGTKQSLTLLGALLATSAFTVPAYAQIETVVVQAEKKSEDLQTVPIAVTAISGDDLKQKQIITFKDLQFNVPNLTFAKTGLGSGVVFIRGIGQAAGDPGVAQYHDGVFSETNDLAAGTYFDLDSVEVLRGPQGTLYGRGSVGGTINLISAKPQMGEFGIKGEATYGEYGTEKGEGAVNIPLIGDTLALRVAGQYLKHGGYYQNISPGQENQNGQDVYATRASLRWQPNDRTTIDLAASHYNDNLIRTRGDNTLCSRDPTGVLGCLPDGLALEPSNAYANALGIETSAQFMSSFVPAILKPLAGAASITNLQVLNGVGSAAAIAGLIPQDITKINTAFTPVFHENQMNVYGHFHHDINDWLKVDFLAGYNYQNRGTTNSYNNLPTEDLSARLATSIPSLLALEGFVGNSPARVANLATEYFGYTTPGGVLTPPATFMLPLSNPTPGGSANYTVRPGGGIQKFTTGSGASDFEVSRSSEKSAELRFSTDFTGPLNFTGGLFAWHRNSPSAFYRVTFSGGDYFSLFIANLIAGSGGLPGTEPYQTVEPMYYQNAPSDADSYAVFGDATYDIIPDELTFRAGLRWSQDTSHLDGDHTAFTGLQSPTPIVPAPYALGTGGAALCPSFCIVPASNDAGYIRAEAAAIYSSTGSYTRHQDSLIDYRGVIEWKPKLDFTDASMFYASYSQGTKPGNVNLIPAAASAVLPATFKPEILKSIEVGTKNTLFDGTLQFNADAWFYNYTNFQYTVIAYSTLFTQNFSAHLWGQELEMVYQPDEHWAFNVNFTNSGSSIGNDFAVDARNPSGGRADAVVVKDIGLNAIGDLPGNNCVVITTTGLAPSDDPNVTASLGGTNPFFAPAGGSAAIAAHNVALANFGNCTTDFHVADLAHPGHFLDEEYHYAGPADGPGDNTTGIGVSLRGNHVLNLPPNTVNAGIQYTWDLDGGMTLVPRVDYYWQNGYFSRVFNDPVDSVGVWDQMNVTIQLNGADNSWFLKAFATNLFDNKSLQALAPASDTSGLYTTAFLEDPRIVGVTLGAHW